MVFTFLSSTDVALVCVLGENTAAMRENFAGAPGKTPPLIATKPTLTLVSRKRKREGWLTCRPERDAHVGNA